MKRALEELDRDDGVSIAYCLVLLSRGEEPESDCVDYTTNMVPAFECKTCNKRFTSFQALGGHRASHKKPRSFTGNDAQPDNSPTKSKIHECSICGLEFPQGQALGGHMRRHRANFVNGNQAPLAPSNHTLVRSNKRRVLCLDLNLTPAENELEFGIGGKASLSHCYL